MPPISYPLRITIMGATVGIALIGALAMYFRRRKKRKPYRDLVRGTSAYDSMVDGKVPPAGLERKWVKRTANNLTSQSRTSNGDISSSRRSLSPLTTKMSRSTSQTSLKSDAASTATLTIHPPQDTNRMSAEQLCELGLETLQMSVRSWEDALRKIDEMEDDAITPATETLQDQLHQMIGRAYYMSNTYQQRLFRQVSTNAAVDAALEQMDREYEERRHAHTGSIGGSSDQDSFVSALDLADLSDLQEHKDYFQHLGLYEAALVELTHGSIPCRSLRTQMLNCLSDTEFLAKLHCIRLAFQELFRDETVADYFAENGRQILSDMLIKADRDPEDFQVAYDDLISWVREKDNWHFVEEELKGRGVKLMTFYDIVLDFILFDAFDDLDNPPSSVITVVQNRWLSNGFKETALATAVWSVLKAKRRLLKVPNGFISHFYAISEHISPVLAWGFLGPAGNLKDLCTFFKDQVLGFMRDAFSFEKARYTNVEALADDILRLMKERVTTTSEHLSS